MQRLLTKRMKTESLGDNIQEESAEVAGVVETEDNPATEEEVEEFDCQVYEKSKRLNMGKHTVVSVYLGMSITQLLAVNPRSFFV